MAYDLELAERIRALVAAETGVDEKRMFGGLAFLINGNMAVAASGRGGLLVRVDPAEVGPLIDGKLVAPMVMGGREMTGWLFVDLAALAADEDLAAWVKRGVGYAKSLPAKKAKR